jgi:hypothetical protein
VSADNNKSQSPRSNPLANSALFNTSPSAPPTLPPIPTVPARQTVPPLPQPEPTQKVEPVIDPTSVPAKEPPLLYQSEPSAEYMMRPFDRQRDKGAVNGNPYLLGAIDAIGVLARKNKYEMFDEMMLEYIDHYRKLLESRPDVVRKCEEKYREKHNL